MVSFDLVVGVLLDVMEGAGQQLVKDVRVGPGPVGHDLGRLGLCVSLNPPIGISRLS